MPSQSPCSLSFGYISRSVEAFECQLCKERNMRKLIIATLVFLLAGLSASYARGGMHGGGMHAGGMQGKGMHGGGMQGLMAPANPSVPPALTSDPRLIGTAPLPPHHQPTSADIPTQPEAMFQPTPEEMAVDQAIGNICRGC
jgi:hypothetical protein